MLTTDKVATVPGYHNPSPFLWLNGGSNEAMVVVDGVELMILADTGSQVSTLTESFHFEFGLKFFLYVFFCLDRIGDISIP